MKSCYITFTPALLTFGTASLQMVSGALSCSLWQNPSFPNSPSDSGNPMSMEHFLVNADLGALGA